jgi:hypothetical protein
MTEHVLEDAYDVDVFFFEDVRGVLDDLQTLGDVVVDLVEEEV